MSTKHGSLKHPPGDLIGGEWVGLEKAGGTAISSRNPAKPDQIIWQGSARLEHVDAAIAAARAALPVWAKWGFSPWRLPVVLLVPFVMVYALARGQMRLRWRAAARPPRA